MKVDVQNSGDNSESGDLPSDPQDVRVCPTCKTPLSADKSGEFCPVCMLRGAFSDTTEFGAESLGISAPFLQEQQFEHYELARDEGGKPVELGRGAMGVTYKAFDVDLHCPVALKVISERYLGDESARLRFLREARAAASLRHPNVASVFHLGGSGGNYFYAMEFVEGETLAQIIKRHGRLEVKLALEIAAQVVAGLAAVHKQNLVHRDIKPTNIMVRLEERGTGTVKIIDLGLAKAVNEPVTETAISMPGAFAGTPEFSSPEQFAAVGVDIRSDLYSLGVTLWNMLTGQVPFRGSVAEVMYQHQHRPMPTEQLKALPQPIVVLLEVLLAKNPARRFQTPAELLEILPRVRDAACSGRSMMKTIRVIVSSTGDVQKERNLAERLMRSIAAEFNLPVSASDLNRQRLAEADRESENSGTQAGREDHGSLMLCPYFWQYQKVQPDVGEQEQISPAAEFDLVICILWCYLGTLPKPTLKMPDGSMPGSGSEYEIASALDHAKKNSGVPELHVYRNRSKPTPPLEPREAREAFGQEWDALQEFFANWEKVSERNLDGAVRNYRSLEEFEELFRERFRRFVAGQLDQDVGQTILRRKVRRWTSSPFRGLNVFSFEHAPIFHGRTKAIGEVLEALEAQIRAQRPFVMVVGASGSGKSSLVQAGVLPLLTQPQTIEGIGLWCRAVTRPGAGGGGDCFDALAAALLDPVGLPVLQDPESTNGIKDLASELREHSDSVALRVRDALDYAAREWKIERCHQLEEQERQLRESGRVDHADVARRQRQSVKLPKARLALVVDQLEELFTTGFSPELRQKYVSAIADLVRSGRVFILATLRSDFYPCYQQFPELIELTKPGGKVDLRPPTAYEIGNMIRLPAAAAGLHFEQEPGSGQRLDEALRDAASATPESLPLLEHVLSLLYDEQADRGDDLLRWSDYRELGELKGALAKHAEAVFNTLQSDEQRAFPLVMRYLVTLGQGEEEVPNRRTVLYRDLVTSKETGKDHKIGAKGFVDLFIEKRLLVADTDPQGEVTVSVAHEALLREWKRVREWLSENREFLRMRDRLDSSLKLWLSRGRQKDDLLGPGLPLAEGEKLIQDFGPSLSWGQTDYVYASVAEQKRRQRARERIRYAVLAGITAALIVAVIFGVVSFRQFRRAERAKLSADQAANRATLARHDAGELINFMTVELRDKLKAIGRLEPLKDVALQALAYYDRLVRSDNSPENRRQQSIAFVNYGDIQRDLGDLAGALVSYSTALNAQKRLVDKEPQNADWQRDLASTWQNIGDVLDQQGKIDDADVMQSALKCYQESFRIRKEFADRYRRNSEWQRDLATSWEKLGDVLYQQGKIDGADVRESALKCYQESLRIRKELVDLDPKNTKWQLDLSFSYADLGDVSSTEEDSDKALAYYGEAKSIREKLARQDNGNVDLQRYLWICYAQIGHVLNARGELQDALKYYGDSLKITEELSTTEPNNAKWKRDYAISLERVGDVLKGQGAWVEAQKDYQHSLSIRLGLQKDYQHSLSIQKEKDYSLLQEDISWSYQEIGDALIGQKKFEEALQNYHDSLVRAEPLAKADQSNKERQSDLAIILEKTGEALSAQRRFEEALQEFDASFAVEEPLTEAEPNISDWQSVLAIILEKRGESLAAEGRITEALQDFRDSLNICEKLAKVDPKNAEWATATALARFGVGMTLPRTGAEADSEIRNMLMRARDILVDLNQRSALSAIDQNYLEEIQAALAKP
jgi:serine/threonine protein kinase/tetratricopeptide (TPR) repeat protein